MRRYMWIERQIAERERRIAKELDGGGQFVRYRTWIAKMEADHQKKFCDDVKEMARHYDEAVSKRIQAIRNPDEVIDFGSGFMDNITSPAVRQSAERLTLLDTEWGCQWYASILESPPAKIHRFNNWLRKIFGHKIEIV